MLWIHGLNVILLVQSRGEMAFLLAVKALRINHCAMDIWTYCGFVSTG